ncbi:MAG: hypothetical protein GX330_07890 [Bacteroidales bacterium]|nr:hypothetical protein [Bacteroidales bacterium]
MKLYTWIVKYKFVIVALLFISYLCVSENSVFLNLRLNKEIKKLENDNRLLQNKCDQMKLVNEEINENKDAMELYMREYYFLKKENEDVFRINYIENTEK